MSFMDLSVKGKASPRHERPTSGKTSAYASRNINTKANVFGIDGPSPKEEFHKQDITRSHTNSSVKSSLKCRTPNAPRDSNGITIPSVSVHHATIILYGFLNILIH